MPYELVKLDLARQENSTRPLPSLYLADRFPEKHLAPPIGSAKRGPYYQWIVFAEVSLEPVVMASILHLANTLGLLDGQPRLVEYVKRHTQRPAVRKAVSG